MKIAGLKIIPIIVSTIAVYLVGMIIYGLIFSSVWQEWSGLSDEQMAQNMWKMSLGFIMPLALSIGIATRIKQFQITNIATAAKNGFFIGVFLLFACQLYNYVYSADPWMILAVDSVHILLICTLSSLILTLMKVAQD